MDFLVNKFYFISQKFEKFYPQNAKNLKFQATQCWKFWKPHRNIRQDAPNLIQINLMHLAHAR
jgi:hypothetical protein